MSMASSDTPMLYRSPEEDSTSSDSHSRSENSTGLMSPLPDLTETVNAITDSYTPVTPSHFDQSWLTFPYYGYIPTQAASMPGLTDDMVGPTSIDNIGGQGGTHASRSAAGLQKTNMYTEGYNQSLGALNPFANMSTAMLQSYLAESEYLMSTAASSGTQQPTNFSGGTISPATVVAGTGTLFRHQPGNAGEKSKQPQLVPERSPSPLLEVEDDSLESMSLSSSEGAEPCRPRRRASDGPDPIKMTSGYLRRMSANLPIEEKLQRAAATQGLSKQDRRRVQNKLAQRAFRARSKVANRNVFGRLEHLEELTETQADRIVKMTELIARLQKENTGLKAAKFEEAMAAMLRTT